jgi:hypothetical protein
MRTSAASSIAFLLFAAACSDLPSAVTAIPAPQPSTVRAELRCTAYVEQPRVTCESTADGAGARRNLIIAGQHVYLRLASSDASYNPADSIFQVNVTVQNLMTQAFGTPDGETDSGLTVFFATGPTPVPAGGNVEVHNEDGEAIFFSSLEPYFNHGGLLYTGETSESRTWQFKMDPEIGRFVFTVFVRGQVPHESSLLLFRPQAEPDGIVTALWGASAAEVFAAGPGVLMRYTGGGWTEDESPTEEFLLDLWGSSATDVFAVGSGGAIVRWNGTEWGTMDSGLEDDGCGCGPPWLWAVWGSGPNDVYAVGEEGVVVHYDGTEWVAGDTLPVYALYTVWGSGPSDVFAAGEDGGIFHYDGTSWTQMTSGLEETGDYVNVLWGLSPTDVYATHSSGVLHYDGVSWSPLAGVQECEHVGIWGSGPDDLFVTNDCGIDHWDGDTWTYMDAGGGTSELWGTSSTHVLSNTNGGVYLGSR